MKDLEAWSHAAGPFIVAHVAWLLGSMLAVKHFA